MKTILITGGSGAIGSMTAYLAVQNGYRVVLAYHQNRQAAENLKEDLEKMGGQLLLVQGDLTQGTHREALIQRAREWGGFDLLVNNFGVAHYAPFTDESDETVVKDFSYILTQLPEADRQALVDAVSELIAAAGGGSAS